jgi:hypothetical protein
LHIHPYRITVVPEIKPVDYEKRVRFCNFNLSGYVNSQNNRYWSSENPHALIQCPLYDQNIGVWCAISANHISGPIFYKATLDVH